jgi:hypothetical protein
MMLSHSSAVNFFAAYPPPSLSVVPLVKLEKPMYPQAGKFNGTSEISSGQSWSGYLARHWRGELSLPASFWINGVFIFFLFSVLVGPALKVALRGDYNPIIASALLASLLLVRILVCVWQIVGIWRAAINHAKLRGRRLWPFLTKLICLGVASLLLYVEAVVTVPIFRSLADMINGDKALGPHIVRILPGGAEIEFVGTITWGGAGDLRKVLDDNPQIRVVHLNSPGGRLGEAETIRNLIRQRGLTTYTSGTCMSACTIAFLGGRERWIGEEARLGFHQGQIPGISWAMKDELIKGMGDVYRRTGISEAFISQILEASSGDIWYPKVAQLLQAGVISGVAALDQFAPSGPLKNIAVRKAVPYASGGMLDAYAKTYIETFEAIERADPEACQLYTDRSITDFVEAEKYITTDLQVRSLEATSRLVGARDFANPSEIKKAPTRKDVEHIYPMLEEVLRSQGTDLASVKAVMMDPARNRNRMCWATIEYYKAVMELPNAEREIFLKYKFNQD